jgi:hypothetical protein
MYSFRNYLALAVSAVTISVLANNFAFAEEILGQKTYEDAMSAFSQRSSTDTAPIEVALSVLNSLENKSDDSDTNYKVFILKARANYWKGLHASTDKEKIAIYLQGQNAAEAAIKINDGYADGYYYAGIHLARWAEANGIFQSIGKKDQLIKLMNDAMNRPTLEGNPGESIDGYGPDRTLGRAYHKLPGVLGGSHSKSLSYLRKAVESKTFLVAQSVNYLADTLASGPSVEKAEAKKILDELLAQDPITYNPARVPETLDEFKDAKELRAKLK